MFSASALTSTFAGAGKFGTRPLALTGTLDGAGKSFGLERLLPRLSALFLLLMLQLGGFWSFTCTVAFKLRMVCVSVSGISSGLSTT